MFGCMVLWQCVGTEMDSGICDECSVLTAFALVDSPGPRPPHIFFMGDWTVGFSELQYIFCIAWMR